jgi:beta-lactamase regulating signal transducer with metallopeptidase domain
MIDAGAWTLVHFLWQGTLVWLLVSVQLRFLRQARTRYLVACVAMLLMLALPLATFILLADGVSPVTQTGGFASSSTFLVRGVTAAAASQTAWMPLVVWLWASGVALFSLRNAGGLALAYLWRRRALIAVPFECHEAARRLAARLCLRRTVRLRGTSGGIAPSVVGWMKPVIVVPAAALGLPFEQVEALLAHELAHIRRHDFLVNLLQNAVETLLFYHPAVWWLGRRIREERENCCDDLAVAVCGDRVIYARALSSLAELRDCAPDFAMAASGGSLVRRIARLLGKSQPATHASSVWLVAVIAVCGAAALAGAILMAEEGGTNPQTVFTEPLVSTPAGSTGQQQVALLAQAQAQPQQPPAAPAASSTPSAASAGSYISQLADAGYADLSVDDLISFKIHGVTADYARTLQNAGFKPNPAELVSMRIHGVTPEYAQALKAGGFANLTIDQLVSGRIHGVTPDAVEQLKGAGMGALTFDDVVSARIHGLTPEFVRGLKDAGFSTLTFDQAIAARIHGVDTNTARELREAGLGSLNFDEVITARIHGITPDFVRRAQQLGLKNLTFDRIVALKIHGVLD